MDKSQKVYDVFETIAPTYDSANTRISLGLEEAWKEALIQHVSAFVPTGGCVLDVCCGTGDIALGIQDRRPDIGMTGLDFSPAMLQVAKAKDTQQKIRWQCGNALHLPFREHTFSAVTISFGLRNTTDYGAVLEEMRRVTTPKGRLYCLDSFVPSSPWIRPFYTAYFRYLMPFLGGGVKKRAPYQWLFTSTQQFLRASALGQVMAQAGWKRIERKPFLFGACELLIGETDGEEIDSDCFT